jgi:hypothetical protein
LRLLFDTNIVLDVLLRRQPFYAEAVRLLARVELGELHGYLGATTVTTLHYFMARAPARSRRARSFASSWLSSTSCSLRPSPTTRTLVLVEAARSVGVGALVTRNAKDFGRPSLTVYTPGEVLSALEARD